MELLIWAALGLIVLGGLGLLLAAFKTSVLWGLLVLFIPPAAILFLILHWQAAKGAFQLQLLGLALVFAVSYFSSGSIDPRDMRRAASVQNASNVLDINNGRQSQSAPWQNQSSNSASNTAYRCDGRVHCSQMTSCAEATFFLRNCPGTKMDGDGNGIPCERQWCRR